MPKHIIFQMRQCVIILILIMYFHTGNVYCGAVLTLHVLIFLTKKKKHKETTLSIRFHIYHIIGRCTTHGIIPSKDKKIFLMCKQESSIDKSTKYTPEKN